MKKMNVILCIEDNPADQVLVKTAFSTLAEDVSVVGAADSEQGFRYLRKQAPYENAATPCLILLDLNLPGKHGKEILAEIKADPVLEKIPVVILSSSIALEDVEDCYRIGANCYLQKPMRLAESLRLLHAVYNFWVKNAASRSGYIWSSPH